MGMLIQRGPESPAVEFTCERGCRLLAGLDTKTIRALDVIRRGDHLVWK